MAVIKNNVSQHPIAGQGIDGQTIHHHVWPVAFAGNIASGDTSEVARLPAGARLISMSMRNSGTNALTFSLGDSTSATRYRANGALAAGAYESNIPASAAFYKIPDSEYPFRSVIATFNAATTIVAGDVLWLNLAYVIDSPTQPAGFTA